MGMARVINNYNQKQIFLNIKRSTQKKKKKKANRQGHIRPI